MKTSSGSALTILLIISSVVAFILLSLQFSLVNFQRQVSDQIYLQTLAIKARSSFKAESNFQEKPFTSYELAYDSEVPWEYQSQGKVLIGRLSQVLASPAIAGSQWRVIQTVVSAGNDESPRILIFQRQTWQLLDEGVVIASETRFPTLIGD